MNTHTDPSHPLLFGAIRFAGSDAATFLQGQLTNDLRLLGPEKPLLAALCNPQGRVFALLELFEDAAGIIALLPASMVEPTIARLRKYVLRAKATIEDASGELPHLAATVEAAGISEPYANEWRLKQIAAGRPQVYPETSELFVAQMLNLDALGAISFDKGCYTGQEIVARAHYRGQVKRRMLRYRTTTGGDLQHGSSVRVDHGRDGKIVELAALPDGGHEFLAVVSLIGTEDTATENLKVTAATTVEPLPLPYALTLTTNSDKRV